MRTRKAYISKRGGREENEDYCSYREREGYGCYILADGLGGHRGGGREEAVENAEGLCADPPQI